MWLEVWKIVSPHFCAPLTPQTSHSFQAAKTIKFMASLKNKGGNGKLPLPYLMSLLCSALHAALEMNQSAASLN